jgi:formylglycine-generating enzyme
VGGVQIQATAAVRRGRLVAEMLGTALLLLTFTGCETAKAQSRWQTVTTARLSAITTLIRNPLQMEAAARGCSVGMARIDNFCIDRFEATLVEVGPDGQEAAHPAFERPRDDVRYEARSRAGELPQGYVSRIQSETACDNAGKRLCSVTEWYQACRGKQRSTYPYGNEFVKNKCNTSKLHLLGKLFGNNPEWWEYDKHFNNPRLNLEPGFLSHTGDHPDCVSDYGTYDMVGNLHEWVSDSVDHSLETKLPMVDGVRRSIHRNTGHGVFMGGFFSTTAQQGEGCNYITMGHEPQYHDYSTGFRCCADAKD